MLSLNLGPFALSMQHLSLLAALAVGMVVAWAIERRKSAGRNAESMVFWVFVVGLLAARLAFVIAYWPQYHADALQIIDVRDAGFMAWPGIVTGVLAALVLGYRRAEQRKALGWGAASGLLLWTLISMATQRLDQDQRLPDVTLQTASGASVALADPKGRPMVVNLWATWCPPCRREMPVLRQGIQDHPEVAFMLVNQGESVEDVSTFLGTVGIDINQVLFDPQSRLAQAVGSRAMPTTLFYSAEGQLLGSHMGELSSASLTHALELFSAP